MEPVTVTWNGPTTVLQAVEQPDATLSCGQFAAAFADAHDIAGTVSLVLDGEPMPDDAPIDLLGGQTVTVRADADGTPRKAAKAKKTTKKSAT